MLSDWEKFIASDAALQVARVCRFYSINPAYYLSEYTDDRLIQLQLAEALMLRLMVFEDEQRKAAEEEAERKQRHEISMESPGTLPRVSPPTPAEIQNMLEE